MFPVVDPVGRVPLGVGQREQVPGVVIGVVGLAACRVGLGRQTPSVIILVVGALAKGVGLAQHVAGGVVGGEGGGHGLDHPNGVGHHRAGGRRGVQFHRERGGPGGKGNDPKALPVVIPVGGVRPQVGLVHIGAPERGSVIPEGERNRQGVPSPKPTIISHKVECPLCASDGSPDKVKIESLTPMFPRPHPHSFGTQPFSCPTYHMIPLLVQFPFDPSFIDTLHARLSPDKNNRRQSSCSFGGRSITTVVPSPINTTVTLLCVRAPR